MPVSAEPDRIQLQMAAVEYTPMAGFEFATSLPSFTMLDADDT